MTTVIVGTRGTSGWPEFGGSTWVRLHYMLGLRKLGIDAFWVDRLGKVDPLKHHHTLEYLTRRFARTMADFGLSDRYCVVYNRGERYLGMTEQQLRDLVDRSDLLINISGHLPPDDPLMGVRRRAYVDVDPGFTQIWASHCDMGLDRHHVFFTVGQNVGTPHFRIPTGGVKWRAIVPPVFLDEWPCRSDPQCQRWSTVADWRGSQEAMFDEEYYGGKRKEFLRLLRLPRDSRQPIELALCIGGFGGRGAAGREQLGPVRPVPLRRRPVQLPGVHPALARGVQRRQGRVREVEQRVGQRPHGVVPGQREARAGAVHGLRAAHPDREGSADVPHG